MAAFDIPHRLWGFLNAASTCINGERPTESTNAGAGDHAGGAEVRPSMPGVSYTDLGVLVLYDVHEPA